MDFDSPITEWWFVAFCTRGVVLVDLFRDVCLWFRKESNHAAPRVLRVVLRAVRQASFGTALSGLELLYDRFVEGYGVPAAGLDRQVAAVVEGIRRDGAPPVGPRVARRDLARMERIADEAGLS